MVTTAAARGPQPSRIASREANSVAVITVHHDEPEKRIDLFRALAVGQLEEPNLKQQCSCDGEQDRDDRLKI